MTSGQFSNAVELSEVPNADFVRGRRKEAESAARKGNILYRGLPRGHGQGPICGNKLHGAVGRQPTRG